MTTRARVLCGFLCQCSLGGLLPGCSSTSPEGNALVTRSTQDLNDQLAKLPGFFGRELGRVDEASRMAHSLFLPDPASVQLASPILRKAIAAEPRRLEELRPGLRLVADTAHFADLQHSVSDLGSRQAGATSLSLALDLQRTSEAVRSFKTLWLWSTGSVGERVDLWGTRPGSPLQEWLTLLLQ